MARDMALPLLISARSFWQTAFPYRLGLGGSLTECELSLAVQRGRALRNRKKGAGVTPNDSVRGYAAKGSQVPFFGVSITGAAQVLWIL